MLKKQERKAYRRAGAVFWGLITVLALAPLPLGSARPLPGAVLVLAVGLLLALWAGSCLYDARHITVRWRRVRGYAIGGAVMFAWLALQISGVTPAVWDHPLWQAAPALSGEPLNGAIAVSPDAGRSQLLLLMSFAGIFWLSLFLTRRPENASRLMHWLIAAAVIYAVYGIAAEWLDGRHVLWFEKTAYVGSVTGPFINRNGFGGYCAMLAVTAIAMLAVRVNEALRARRRARRRRRPAPKLLGRGEYLLIAAALILLLALLLTQSRGAFLAFLAGSAMIFIGLGVKPARQARRSSTTRRMLPLFGLGVLAAFSVLTALFGGEVLNRFADLDERAHDRVAIHSFTAERIAERPLLGAGLGAFPRLYRAYVDVEFLSAMSGAPQAMFFHAHNSYLEFGAEAGLPALGLLLIGFAAIGRSCWQGLRRRRQGIGYPLAALAAMTVMGVHALVDFSVEIPAVAATFAAILGCGLAQSWSRVPAARLRAKATQ